MATMKSSGDLIASISADMADNNAGLISAEDVRSNMEDTAFSINKIVASGDTETAFPFYNNVTIKKTGSNKGELYVESGVKFPNGPANPSEFQVEPWLGAGRLAHNDLAGLTTAHPHTQYYHVNGVTQADNVLQGHVPVGHANWINASGYSDVGFRFNPKSDDGKTQDIMTSGTFAFDDNSRIANAKGTAKAWCHFNASGDSLDNAPEIYSYHNISGISRFAPGKIRVTFTSGTFRNNEYVAIGTSNSRGSASSPADFDVNTVGIVERTGNDGTALRSLTFCILNDADEFVDAEQCDLVVYGYEPNESSGTVPTAIKDPIYNPAG